MFFMLRYYSRLESLLLIFMDHLDGVESSVEVSDQYPTGVTYVRDASHAKALKDRLSPDSPLSLCINALLRGLNAMRAINYVLEKKRQFTLIVELDEAFIDFLDKMKS